MALGINRRQRLLACGGGRPRPAGALMARGAGVHRCSRSRWRRSPRSGSVLAGLARFFLFRAKLPRVNNGLILQGAGYGGA